MKRSLALATVLVLAGIGLASAQETTGTIAGRIVDSQGLAVPGAMVIVTGAQGAKEVVSDGEGRFRAPFLTPGTYAVRVELQGFRTVEQRNIIVRLGQTADLTLTLEVGALAEAVEVTATSPVVDTNTTTVGANLDSELLQRVPVGRRFSDTLYIAPGVSTGGTVGQANPSIGGGSGLDNQYVVDGVNITNAGYGALGSYSIVFGSLGNGTPFDFIKEVQVKSGGYEAEFGQSTGGVVNVVTKSGSNNLRGSAFGYFQPEKLESDWKQFQSTNGTVNTVATRLNDGGIEAGGPILPNRVFFFGAVDPQYERRVFVAPEGFPLESLGEVPRDRRIVSYSGKVTWQMTSTQRFDASFFGDPAMGENGPQRTSALLATDTSSFSELTKYGGHNQVVKYDAVYGSNWLIEASLGRAKNTIEETPSINTWRVRDRTVVPNVISGGIGFFEKGNEGENIQYTAKSTHIFGGHQIRYGVQFEDIEYSQINSRTGPTFAAPDGQQTATGANIDILADPVFGQIYRVVRANFNSGRLTTQEYLNVFVQDTWRVGNRLTIKPGLRYEQQKLVGTLVDDFTLDGNWAPRIGATYDVVGNGKSKLYGNWGRYFQRIPNDLAARALSADAGITRADYFDANLTRPIPEGTLAAGVTQHFLLAGTGADVIDPDVKSSYLDEAVAGFEYEVLPLTSVGVRYIYRNTGRVLEDIAAFPMAAYDLGLPGTDSVEYILTNPSPSTPTGAPELGAAFEKAIHRYDAIEVTADKRFADNWSLQASYRWSRLHGTFEGSYRDDNGQSDPGITSLFDFPTNDPSYTAIGVPQFGYQGDIRFLGELGEGPLPLDRPHQFKVYGNYTLPMGLNLGLGFNISSGKPLTALAANPNYTNGGEIPLTPRGDGFDTVDGFKTRTPVLTDTNFHADWALRFGGSQRLVLLADVFNVFDTKTTLDYDNFVESTFGVTNPDFGQPVSSVVSGPQFQAPRRIRLGVRFEF